MGWEREQDSWMNFHRGSAMLNWRKGSDGYTLKKLGGKERRERAVTRIALCSPVWREEYGEKEKQPKYKKAFNFYRNLYIYLLEVFLVREVHAGGQTF